MGYNIRIRTGTGDTTGFPMGLVRREEHIFDDRVEFMLQVIKAAIHKDVADFEIKIQGDEFILTEFHFSSYQTFYNGIQVVSNGYV